jgi:hypothetical protein
VDPIRSTIPMVAKPPVKTCLSSENIHRMPTSSHRSTVQDFRVILEEDLAMASISRVSQGKTLWWNRVLHIDAIAIYAL